MWRDDRVVGGFLARGGAETLGVDMLDVVEVGACLEAPAELHSRGADLDGGVVIGQLGGSVPDGGIEAGMDELGVVFVHDLLLDDGGVLVLLGEPGLQQEHLDGQDDLQHETVEDGDARSRIPNLQGQEHHVDEDVAGAEEAEHL